MWHGNVDSSEFFVSHYKEYGLAFTASDAGYDVWLGNSRGNQYSRRHLDLDPDYDTDEFFDFSFEEMGYYDVPAVLKTIEQVTQQRKVAYIGHSQGCGQMFYGLSERPEFYKDRISIFLALGPSSFMDNAQSFAIEVLSDNLTSLTWLTDFWNREEVMAEGGTGNRAVGSICSITPKFCGAMNTLVADARPELNDEERLGVYLAHFPSGSAFKAMAHFAQLYGDGKEGKFLRFDYGEEGNLEKYGQVDPPEINLEAIEDLRIVLAQGTADELVNAKDTRLLYNMLKQRNNVTYHEYELGHLGFGLAVDMDWWLDELLPLLEKHHPL